jgi:transcriptional regulator with XRE-family HTH domain
MQNVIKRFILARKALALTQAEMAASLGFKQSYISNIEKGRNEVTSNIIIALYKLYSISPDWLITGEGEMLSKHPSRTGIPLPEDASLPESVQSGTIVVNPVSTHSPEPWIESLQTTIKTQQTTISLQEKMIKMLEDELNRAKSKPTETLSS